MRFIRFVDQDNQTHQGWIADDTVGIVEGSIFGAFQRQEASIPFRKIRLLPPVAPSKIICLGRNYAEHAREHGADIPTVPLLFLKPPSALIAQGETILLPAQSRQVEFEGELAVVIGKKATHILADQTRQYILGYTIANDVTARDLQKADNQWTRAKGFDTFCPTGPWIDTSVDPFDLLISTHVNGILRQMSSTKDMIFPIFELVAYISSIMTLEAGDLILTGTPAGVGELKPGDHVTVTIEGIGELTNLVSTYENI
jgi:2-keto-4-pentenoate hydratase/2-oxohepta-3-ene-1,7-dioic acid hydratase in catechol pathway